MHGAPLIAKIFVFVTKAQVLKFDEPCSDVLMVGPELHNSVGLSDSVYFSLL